jgi:hypothetical protein
MCSVVKKVFDEENEDNVREDSQWKRKRSEDHHLYTIEISVECSDNMRSSHLDISDLQVRYSDNSIHYIYELNLGNNESYGNRSLKSHFIQYFQLMNAINKNLQITFEYNGEIVKLETILSLYEHYTHGSAKFSRYTLGVLILLNNKDAMETTSDLDIQIVQCNNGRILSDQKSIINFIKNCFTPRRSPLWMSKAIISSHGANEEAVIEGSKFILKDNVLEEHCISQFYNYRLFNQELLESIGVQIRERNEADVKEHGLISSINYGFSSVNDSDLTSITIVLNSESNGGFNLPEESFHLLGPTYSKLLDLLLLKMKSSDETNHLFMSRKERKLNDISGSYIPTIARSIQQICQLSKNADFLSQCLELLHIDDINQISSAVEKKLLDTGLSNE